MGLSPRTLITGKKKLSFDGGSLIGGMASSRVPRFEALIFSELLYYAETGFVSVWLTQDHSSQSFVRVSLKVSMLISIRGDGSIFEIIL